jgi:hypothetical protein
MTGRLARYACSPSSHTWLGGEARRAVRQTDPVKGPKGSHGTRSPPKARRAKGGGRRGTDAQHLGHGKAPTPFTALFGPALGLAFGRQVAVGRVEQPALPSFL